MMEELREALSRDALAEAGSVHNFGLCDDGKLSRHAVRNIVTVGLTCDVIVVNGNRITWVGNPRVLSTAHHDGIDPTPAIEQVNNAFDLVSVLFDAENAIEYVTDDNTVTAFVEVGVPCDAVANVDYAEVCQVFAQHGITTAI
jgi:hypothetical protein